MPAIDVITAGLETSVQDFPGRYGFWEQGFPPSGPFDMWSFRLANILVGNAPEAAGLECQFMGPTLRFTEDCLIALCGAEMNATLDGQDIAQWQSVAVAAGQTLACGFASVGARAYLAVSGGIEVAPVLGSRATFHMAGVGGVDGHALKDGQSLNVNPGAGTPGRRVKKACRPPIANGREWRIEVVQGP
ncbi:MAG: biotin-dependent carboxyltransferase family protein, partial [Alphaproteobacteria bacterium]|nr:biotin-dependent carboxyltransferase family protein [Alphaproteobacteria bacterium]